LLNEYHGALLNVLAGLAGSLVRAHVSEDLSNVLVDDLCAVSRCGLAFDLSQMLALDQQLCQERRLVGDVVVEVVTGDVDDNFASAAWVVRTLALLALKCLKYE
jgi:hypothetical protein